jgi:hypothetical protein
VRPVCVLAHRVRYGVADRSSKGTLVYVRGTGRPLPPRYTRASAGSFITAVRVGRVACTRGGAVQAECALRAR